MAREPEVFQQAFDLYCQAEFEKAYNLLTNTANLPTAWIGRWYEIRMDLAARCGWLELAEDLLQTALDQGYFYNEFVLRLDEEVKVLQGRPRFESLVERSFKALQTAQSISQPQLKILEPETLQPELHPLMIYLHGNNHTAADALEEWKPLVKENWLVALPQSSQISGKNQFVWNDFDRVDREIPQHYQSICKAYQIDPQKTIVSGFSKGGHAAIYAVMRGLIPARGFIALAPFVGDGAWLTQLIQNMENKILRGYFILGGKDEDCTPGAIKLIDRLRTYGLTCDMEMFPEMSHEFPDPFDAVIHRAIQFILEE